MRRRHYLTVAGSSIATTLAGCTGGGDGGSTATETSGSSGDSGGGDSGGTTTATQSGVEALPPKSEFEAYKEEWKKLAAEKAEEEGGDVVIYGFSEESTISIMKDFFENTEPYSVLNPTFDTANPDKLAQKYQQSTTAQEPTTDVLAMGQSSLLIEDGVPFADITDVPAYVGLPDGLKLDTDHGSLGSFKVNSRGICYNTDMIEPPSSWGELLTDKYSGVSAAMDFTFTPSVAPQFLNQQFEMPSGETVGPQEIADGVTSNLDFNFEASVGAGASDVARGNTAMQFFGAATFIVDYVDEGLPIDMVRMPETIYPYSQAVGMSKYPTNEWSARLATHAYIAEPELSVLKWGNMTPNREGFITHPELGSTKDLYEGSKIGSSFKYDKKMISYLEELQEVWGAPA